MISKFITIIVLISVSTFVESFTMSKSIKSFFSPSASAVKRTATEMSSSAESVSTVSDSRETKVSKVSEDVSASDSAQTTSAASDTTGWLPFDTLEPVWKSKLLKERSKPYFRKLEAFVESEAKSHTVFPPRAQIFSALNLCPFDDVKVLTYMCSFPFHLVC